MYKKLVTKGSPKCFNLAVMRIIGSAAQKSEQPIGLVLETIEQLCEHDW
jgi:hypothetical protein